MVERTMARNLQATAKAPVAKEKSFEKEPLRYSLNEQFQRDKRPSTVRGQGRGQTVCILHCSPILLEVS